MALEKAIIAARLQEVNEGLVRQSGGLVEAHFRKSKRLGAAARICNLIRGADVVSEYEALLAACGELGVVADTVDAALRELEGEWALTKRHPLLPPGHSTMGANVIRGGPGEIATPYIIPDFCTIDYCIWYPPQIDVEEVKGEIERCITATASTDAWLREHPPKIEWVYHWPPYAIPEDHPICRTVLSAHEQVTGKKTKVTGCFAVYDAAFLTPKGIPAVAYGAGGEGLATAHGVDELVVIEDLIRATKVLALTILDWCGYSE